jgi:glycosyltransferase involved in cell wall biosynthesis
VIVVDDGSDDGTKIAVENGRWPFHVVCLRQQNSGPGTSRNLGVKSAQGEIVAFTEDDIEVHPDWLKNALPRFNDPSVALVEGRTVYSHSEEDVRRFEGTPRHSFIPCNLFVRRDVFVKVGGYDPAFYDPETKLYFREDADLGFRILDLGEGTKIASDVVVEHPQQFTNLTACFRHARRYMFDPLLYKKHPAHFRQRIEVKDVLGLVVNRPQHYLALLYLVLVVATVNALIGGIAALTIGFAASVFVCSLLFRYKYQGMNAMRLDRVTETLGFLLLPLVYVVAFLKGCFRFRSFGAIL